jgi:peptidoglycan hydrolase CwlO-like protein
MIKLEEITLGKKTIVIIAVGVLIIGAACWLMFSRGIPDTGSGIDKARTNIQSVGDKQQSAIDRLGTVETGLERSASEIGHISTGLKDTAGAINSVEGRISKSESKLNSSAGLIAEGKSILGQIRARGQIRN